MRILPIILIFLGAISIVTLLAQRNYDDQKIDFPERREADSIHFAQTREALPPMKNPQLVIKKERRELQLFDGEKLIKTYKIALGFAPVGDKNKQGDGKTPEGEFYIFTKNPQSKFYLSLGLSYPNIEDAKRGLKQKIITRKQHDAIVKAINAGVAPPQNTALGGEIYIHGGGNSDDWTWGCAALRDEEIKEVFEVIPIGARVRILP